MKWFALEGKKLDVPSKDGPNFDGTERIFIDVDKILRELVKRFCCQEITYIN